MFSSFISAAIISGQNILMTGDILTPLLKGLVLMYVGQLIIMAEVALIYCYVMIGRGRLGIPGQRLVEFVRWHYSLGKSPNDPEPLMKFGIPECEWAPRDTWNMTEENDYFMYISCKYSGTRSI